ncbi:MAG: 1-acyl-sn-glycerol-3-phosphate acyltransferase [Firmicutes bacterium]|nr:1-acyl-sn-glycerol-3-phosphate acyltransferase [Bacillota bacterium]
MLYWFVKLLLTAFFRVFYRFEVRGTEHIPKKGALIVVANHSSALDPLALGAAFPRPIAFMAKSELFRNPILGGLLRALYAFPVRRGLVDRDAYRRSIDILKAGKVLGVFPEGTRSETGELLPPHAGAGRFALQTGTSVLPAALLGTHAAIKKGTTTLKKSRIVVVFGDPIVVRRPDDGRLMREEVDSLSRVLMEKVQELMTES